METERPMYQLPHTQSVLVVSKGLFEDAFEIDKPRLFLSCQWDTLSLQKQFRWYFYLMKGGLDFVADEGQSVKIRSFFAI